MYPVLFICHDNELTIWCCTIIHSEFWFFLSRHFRENTDTEKVVIPVINSIFRTCKHSKTCPKQSSIHESSIGWHGGLFHPYMSLVLVDMEDCLPVCWWLENKTKHDLILNSFQLSSSIYVLINYTWLKIV